MNHLDIMTAAHPCSLDESMGDATVAAREAKRMSNFTPRISFTPEMVYVLVSVTMARRPACQIAELAHLTQKRTCNRLAHLCHYELVFSEGTGSWQDPSTRWWLTAAGRRLRAAILGQRDR